MSGQNEAAKEAYLLEFFAAFNTHDAAKLKSMMTDDVVFETLAGAEAYGNRIEGAEAVANAFSGVFSAFPDAQWANPVAVVKDDLGVVTWTFQGTNAEGMRVDADGVDLFTFRDGKLASKKAFRKDRPMINTNA